MAKNHYTDKFKQQIVCLYKISQTPEQLANDYQICKSTVWKWVHQFINSGLFKAKDNRTPEENELIELRKEVKQLRMENYILKQATLIIGKKQQSLKITKQNIQLLIYIKHWNLLDQHYYQLKANNPKNTQNTDNAIISVFLKSRKNYGTRKIKIMLS